MQLDATQIIKRPLITEKSTLETDMGNSYSFMVHMKANKHQIKQAVKELYDVRVDSVRTMVRKGEEQRTRFGVRKAKSWKKAVVRLHDDDRIDLF